MATSPRYDPGALRRLLDERAWTLDQLSRRSRVRKQTIHNIAMKRTRPRADILASLARGLAVPIAAFFTSDAPMSTPAEALLAERRKSP